MIIFVIINNLSNLSRFNPVWWWCFTGKSFLKRCCNIKMANAVSPIQNNTKTPCFKRVVYEQTFPLFFPPSNNNSYETTLFFFFFSLLFSANYTIQNGNESSNVLFFIDFLRYFEVGQLIWFKTKLYLDYKVGFMFFSFKRKVIIF